MRKFLSSIFLVGLFFSFIACKNEARETQKEATTTASTDSSGKSTEPEQSSKVFDTAKFDRILKELANGDTTGKWPPKMPYPLPGAVLPFHRIIAFYGNLYSTRMGILGELPKDQMIKKLKGEMAEWQAADTSIPVMPALHYIAVTAQGAPGKDGKYRARMPFHQIDTIINWAKEINALVFLDVQVGHSNIRTEAEQLEKYMAMPQVNLGIDPEFSMKNGERPGTKIGTFTGEDINSVIDFLAGVVKKNNLPPKILVVHRFTEGMVRGYDRIKKVPEVQIVMDMDGWGDKTLKRSSYKLYEYRDPVEFTGFKLFYKNDIRKDPNGMLTKQEVLALTPKPIYIQYQ